MGEVTITRANVIVAQPAVGDLIYEGDLIETGINGLIVIVFVDGTTFHLYASAHMVLDEFICGAGKSSNSALFRILRGVFSFFSGKVATTGRLIIDTPVARIQNIRPAAGIGSLAFSVFTIGLIHELKAASADIALLDDGTIACKDLKHGVFEIVTKGDHPQRYIVDDPCVSIDFQLRGSQYSVSEVANTPAQMAQFHDAFVSTLDNYMRGQQDPLIQQWQHANAQPQGTFTVGSSTPLGELNNLGQLSPENIGTPSTGNPNNGTTNTTTTTTAVAFTSPPAPLPPPPSTTTTGTFVWNSGTGSWDTPGSWNPGSVPAAPVDIVIINSGTVTYNDTYSLSELIVEPGATLIIAGGSLAVGTIYDYGNIEFGGDPPTIIGGTLSVSGTFDVENGTGTLDGVTVTNTGTIEVGATTTATLVLDGGTTISGGNLTLGTGATLDVEDGPGATLNGVTVTNSGATIEVGVTTTGATLTLEDGTKVTGGTLTIGSGSTLDIEKGAGGPGATLDGVSVTDNGVIDVGTSSTATLTLAGTDTITGGSGSEVDNSGAIDVTGNTIIKVASIVGGGSDNISATGATLELDAATDAQTVNFSGYVGTLKLDLPADFTGDITGLVVGDVIDLAGISVTKAVIDGSTLNVTESNGTVLSYTVAAAGGSFVGDYFSLQSDSASGTDLVLSVTPIITETAPTSLIVNENTAIALSGLNAISVSETPNTSDVLTTTLTVSHGNLNVGTDSGTTVVYSSSNGNSDGTVTLSGTAAQITAALATTSYTGSSNFYGTDSLSVQTTDTNNGDTASVTKTVGITLADTTTVSETVPASLSGNENTAISLSGLNAITVTDSPNTTDVLTTTLTVSHGNLNVGTDGDAIVTYSPNGSNADGTVTLSGTAAAITAALATTSYTSSNYYGADSLSVTTTDTNNGDTASVAKSVGITVNHVAPTVTAGSTVTFTGGGSAVVLDAGLLVNDVDSGGVLTGATVSIGSTHFLSGDTLNFTNANGITGSYNSSTGTLTLSGSATIAQYQAALESVTYSFTANGDPTAGGTDPSRTISWSVTDGSTSNGTSNTATSTLTDVHVAPTVTAGSTVTFTGGGSAVVLDAGLLVNDVDSGGVLTGATVSIGSTHFLSGDTLNFTNANGITGSYNSSTGTLTLSGSATIAQYQAALESVTYSFTDPGVEPLGTARTISWLVTDGVANSNTATSKMTLSANAEGPEPPTLLLGGTTATVNEEGTVLLPSITVKPFDSDDDLTVTIAGLPTGATITYDGTVYSGSSFTLAEPRVGTTFTLNDLTLNDGTNDANFKLTVTANNTTAGEQTSSLSQTIAVTVNNAPAGVAGSPINLALANSPAAGGGPVAVTITDIPSGWQLNEGTNLGNGTWTVQTNDLSTLTVLTAAAYVGATVLGVTETWTNADGSTGTATVADNVEAYAPGTPIFALAGNDTLTGAGGNTEYVFAQPIGNDTIYNFNVATDKIDLVGFANVASFTDIQADLTTDTHGNAMITIGAGETITLNGVNAASLTAADFMFNQTPVIDNAGNMVVSDGAVLPLNGTIDNTGIIALNSTGDATELQIVGNGVTLEGGGQLTLSDNAANIIIGTGPNDTLTNVDNTISGAGQIGSGDGNLTLINEAHGTIDANVAGGTLTLETGTTITNDGILEATNGGTLQIDDPVIGNGNAIIAGGTLVFDAQSNVNVTFNNGTGTPTYGELVLGNPSDFSGQISGFTGTAPDTAHSDAIDLAGFDFASTTFSESSSNGNLVLTATDGSNVATLTFDDFNGTLSFASDGDKGTLITDPPPTAEGAISFTAGGSNDTYSESVTQRGSGYVGTFSLEPVSASNGSASLDWQFDLGHDQINFAPGQTVTQSYDVNVTDPQNPAENVNQTVSVSIGGPGNDNFVFQPGIGADTIINFNPQADTIELDHFANVQSVQQLASLITTDAHGDAVIELGHNDSITLPGVTTSYLQAHLQSLVHLH
jgi:hypothetical protein